MAFFPRIAKFFESKPFKWDVEDNPVEYEMYSNSGKQESTSLVGKKFKLNDEFYAVVVAEKEGWVRYVIQTFDPFEAAEVQTGLAKKLNSKPRYEFLRIFKPM